MSEEPSIKKNPPHHSKKLVILGISITTFYLIVVSYIALSHWQSMLSLEPNEWGDYLAGVFGPLAFLWLVLGFFQQGDELRYSAEALWLQSEELKNSVEQQKALVEATRQQIDFEKETLSREREEIRSRSQPIFKIQFLSRSSIGDGQFELSMSVTNVGQDCTDLQIYQNDIIKRSESMLARGQRSNFTLAENVINSTQNFIIEYIDFIGNRNTKRYRCLGKDLEEIES